MIFRDFSKRSSSTDWLGDGPKKSVPTKYAIYTLRLEHQIMHLLPITTCNQGSYMLSKLAMVFLNVLEFHSNFVLQLNYFSIARSWR